MNVLPYPPRVTAFTQPFWNGLRRGVLTTTRCMVCHYLWFPPKFLCPRCWSEAVEWTPLAGSGVLRSFTEVWAAPAPFTHEVPYVLGIVDLVEGIRCLSRIAASYDSLAVDSEVELLVVRSEPVPLFQFRPLPAAQELDRGGAR